MRANNLSDFKCAHIFDWSDSAFCGSFTILNLFQNTHFRNRRKFPFKDSRLQLFSYESRINNQDFASGKRCCNFIPFLILFVLHKFRPPHHVNTKNATASAALENSWFTRFPTMYGNIPNPDQKDPSFVKILNRSK